MTRSAKDTENINARPSRSTTRAKSALAAAGAAVTATAAAVNTRAAASTAASKPKSVASTITTEAAGAKRKREVLVEVTGLVTNHKGRGTGAAGGLKGKEKESAGNTTTKTAKTAVKPSVRTGGVTLRRGLRSGSEGTTISNSKTDTDGPALEQDEKMEVDDPLDVPPPPPVASKHLSMVVGEEGERVFKRRHTEKQELETLDESQLEVDKVAADLVEETLAPSGQLWDDLDAEDWDDPVMVSEYVVEVCVYLKQVEVRFHPICTNLILRRASVGDAPKSRLYGQASRNYLGTPWYPD